jgi:DNA primase
MSKVITCWRCGTKGPITKYIKEVEHIPYSIAETVAIKYSDLTIKDYAPAHNRVRSGQVLKPEFLKELMPITRRYLEDRGFDVDELITEYDLMDGGNTGSYAWRIIIPIIMGGSVVSYTARTIQPADIQATRYKMCPDEQALLPRNELLYNIDNVSRGVIICEGPTDVWRMGRGSVATMGTKFSSGQISLIKNKKVKRAFVLYDPQAEGTAERLASSLRPFCPHVEVVYLDGDKDPGDLSPEEATYIRRDLLGF